VNTGYDTLFAGSDAIILARYPAGTGNIDSSIDAVTRTGNRSFDKTFPVISGSVNSFVPKLWAHTKIQELMDQMVIEGETDALVSEITDLSLEFGFVTPYTSLFVEVPVIDKISEATTEPGTLAEPEAMVTATQAYGGEDATGAAMPVPTSVATSTSAPRVSETAAYKATESATEFPTEAETAQPTQEPGFGALFATTSLAVVAYLVRRR